MPGERSGAVNCRKPTGHGPALPDWLRGLITPRRRWQVDRLAQVELHAEAAAIRARQFVDERLVRIDLHRPGVVRGSQHVGTAEHRHRIGIGRELLALGGARRRAVATVQGDRVGAAVFVAMVVLQPQPVRRAGQHPGPRVVITDMERDAQLVRRVGAAAHMHDQALPGERILGGRCRRVLHHLADVGLAAMCGDGGHERIGRCGRQVMSDCIGALRARSEAEQEGGGSGNGNRSHAPTLTAMDDGRKPRASPAQRSADGAVGSASVAATGAASP